MYLKDYPEKLQPYVFHGVSVNYSRNSSATTVKGDCPFCAKEGHLGINVSTGQFRCVRCENSGNVYSFLELLWKESAANTSNDDYQELADARGVSVESLRIFGVVKSFINGDWLIPGYNTKIKLANLYRVIIEEDSKGKTAYRALSTPTCKIQPFGTQLLRKTDKLRYVCEGPWDGMALWDVLNVTVIRGSNIAKVPFGKGLIQERSVWCVPGAGNFQEEWLYHCEGKNTDFILDNDHPLLDEKGKQRLKNGKPIMPGYDGVQRILELASNSKLKLGKIGYIKWGEDGYDPNLPSGYDTRDLIKDQGIQALKRLGELRLDFVPKKKKKKTTETEKVELIDPLECTSFDQLCEAYDTNLFFSETMKNTLAVMLSAIVSTRLTEDPLWIRVIGPPGAGKTTFAEACSSARKYVTPLSVLTGFHSGYVDMKDKEKDTSLIPELNGKTIIMKDADTLVKSSSQPIIMSQLRDMYDGSTRAAYRNQKKNSYENIRITFILCGTLALRALSKDAYLGERFLDVVIVDDKFDSAPILDRAMDNAWESFLAHNSKPEESESQADNSAMLLKRLTMGYINHMMENFDSLTKPSLPETSKVTIKALADLLAYMRARVQRSGADMDYRPQIEVAGRLVKQLTKLAFCCSLVIGKSEVDEDVIKIVRKVVMDTCAGFQFEITRALLEHPDGLATMQLRSMLQLPDTTIRRWTTDMQELGIIKRSTTPNNSNQRGRDLHIWQITDTLREIWAKCTRAYSLPKNSPAKKPRRKPAMTQITTIKR